MREKLVPLKNVNIFSNLDESELEVIAGNSEFYEYKKGDVIFKEGDYSDGLYVIAKGEVLIVKEREGEKRGRKRGKERRGRMTEGERKEEEWEKEKEREWEREREKRENEIGREKKGRMRRKVKNLPKKCQYYTKKRRKKEKERKER